jgi:predicted O-methyltransferase YrrM
VLAAPRRSPRSYIALSVGSVGTQNRTALGEWQGHNRKVGPDQTRLARVQTARRSLAIFGPSEVRSGGDFERVSLPAEDADVLRDLLIAERPNLVIEIGLAYGSSALAIAEALVSVGSVVSVVSVGSERPRHLIIDVFQEEFHDAGWQAIVDSGLGELCWLIRERSQMALPRLLAEGFVADAAFVDGSHVFHNVFVDLYFLSELVRPGGLLIIDDYQWQSVATAARYFELNTGWKTEPTAKPTRLRAFRLPDPRPAPTFEDSSRMSGG